MTAQMSCPQIQHLCLRRLFSLNTIYSLFNITRKSVSVLIITATTRCAQLKLPFKFLRRTSHGVKWTEKIISFGQCVHCKSICPESWFHKSIKTLSHQAKAEAKAKFSSLFVVYSLIFSDYSLIFFAFAPALAWCEYALTRQTLPSKSQHRHYIINSDLRLLRVCFFWSISWH